MRLHPIIHGELVDLFWRGNGGLLLNAELVAAEI